MTDLDKARNLLFNLKEKDKQIEELEKDMKVNNSSYLEMDRMSLIMEISDIYETLDLLLKKMNKDKNNKFIVNRLRTQAELIIGGVQKYDSNTSH